MALFEIQPLIMTLDKKRKTWSKKVTGNTSSVSQQTILLSKEMRFNIDCLFEITCDFEKLCVNLRLVGSYRRRRFPFPTTLAKYGHTLTFRPFKNVSLTEEENSCVCADYEWLCGN